MFCHYYGQAKKSGGPYKQPMTLRIRQMRVARGWTQDELATRSHMSRSQLAMIEAETRPANTLRLKAIADAFGVEVQDLYVRQDGTGDFMALVESLSPEDREIVTRLAEALAAKAKQAE